MGFWRWFSELPNVGYVIVPWRVSLGPRNPWNQSGKFEGSTGGSNQPSKRSSRKATSKVGFCTFRGRWDVDFGEIQMRDFQKRSPRNLVDVWLIYYIYICIYINFISWIPQVTIFDTPKHSMSFANLWDDLRAHCWTRQVEVGQNFWRLSWLQQHSRTARWCRWPVLWAKFCCRVRTQKKDRIDILEVGGA